LRNGSKAEHMDGTPLDRPGNPASRAPSRFAPLARLLGDVLVPPLCLSCRSRIEETDALCAACWKHVSFITAPLCDRLGIPLPFDTGAVTVSAAALADPPVYDRARAVAQFDDIMRRLVHALKYGDRHDGVVLFGRWLHGAALPLLPGVDLIVPVPLNRWRLWRRRFNQAALLGQALGRHAGLPVDPLALLRVKATPSQVGMTADQRRRNVQAAFKVPARKKRLIEGRSILLVDDVITTGATANACARVLKRAGAARVDVVALALVTPGGSEPSVELGPEPG
jgi:ComF family protein